MQFTRSEFECQIHRIFKFRNDNVFKYDVALSKVKRSITQMTSNYCRHFIAVVALENVIISDR